jgi:hypothetical protein
MSSVSGQLVYEDNDSPIKELKGCTIMFDPEVPGKAPRGTIDENGRFNLGTTADGDGAPPGKYKVTVTQHRREPERPVLGKPCVLDIYEDPAKTTAIVTVEPGRNDLTIKLKRRGSK